MARGVSIASILVLLGIPFLLQLDLFPLQKLSMFSSPIATSELGAPATEIGKFEVVIRYDGQYYQHPLLTKMGIHDVDCSRARNALRGLFAIQDTSLPFEAYQFVVRQGDTLSKTTTTCP